MHSFHGKSCTTERKAQEPPRPLPFCIGGADIFVGHGTQIFLKKHDLQACGISTAICQSLSDSAEYRGAKKI